MPARRMAQIARMVENSHSVDLAAKRAIIIHPIGGLAPGVPISLAGRGEDMRALFSGQRERIGETQPERALFRISEDKRAAHRRKRDGEIQQAAAIRQRVDKYLARIVGQELTVRCAPLRLCPESAVYRTAGDVFDSRGRGPACSLPLTPEVYPVDAAVREPEAPMVRMVAALAGYGLHRPPARDRMTVRSENGIEEGLVRPFRGAVAREEGRAEKDIGCLPFRDDADTLREGGVDTTQRVDLRLAGSKIGQNKGRQSLPVFEADLTEQPLPAALSIPLQHQTPTLTPEEALLQAGWKNEADDGVVAGVMGRA